MNETSRIVVLGISDLDAVYELYSRAIKSAPFGHLAPRQLTDFEQILQADSEALALGTRVEDKLVAYSLCRRVYTVPYDNTPHLSRIDPIRSPIYVGVGTVIHPQYQGRLFMARMLRKRAELLRHRNVRHMVGLVAVDNIPSIANVLRTDGILIGFAEDETALNYIAYRGALNWERFVGDTTDMVSLADHAGQNTLFEAGLVSFKMSAGRDQDRSLAFGPLTDGSRLRDDKHE